MNILQTIWSALTVENELLVKILLVPLSYLDAFIGMLFFTTLLDIDTSKKRKIIYVLLYATLGSILTFVIPTSYTVFINIIIWPILIFLVLKTTILKSILAEVITLVTTSILEFAISSIFLNSLEFPL